MPLPCHAPDVRATGALHFCSWVALANGIQEIYPHFPLLRNGQKLDDARYRLV